jgi:hypothetical protein
MLTAPSTTDAQDPSFSPPPQQDRISGIDAATSPWPSATPAGRLEAEEGLVQLGLSDGGAPQGSLHPPEGVADDLLLVPTGPGT